MPNSKLFSITLAATLLTLVLAIHSLSAKASDQEIAAAVTIDNAEKTLVSAYKAVREASETGANVSTLLNRLNNAGGYLVQARISFQQGDFENSINAAALSDSIGNEISNEAEELRNKTNAETSQRVGLTVFASSIAIVSIILFGFFLWRVLERRFYRRLLKMKPEIIDNANDN